MRILFSGEVSVHYGQMYVASGEDGPELGGSFAGQTNGLCGGAVPGELFLVTGLHTGSVDLTVEAGGHEPSVDDSWQEIVEVSFLPQSTETVLMEWAGEHQWPLDLEQVSYRVRYSATGMDEADELGARTEEEPRQERYLLQFWPAPPTADTVIKQTSRTAAYWHGVARRLPPPPSAEEQAETALRKRLEQEKEEERLEAASWGGRLPSERLRQIGGNVSGMVELDPELVHAIAATTPQTQRAIAVWVARRALSLAGLCALDWVAPALEAAEGGQTLPAPFDDVDRVWDMLFTDQRVPETTVVSLRGNIPDMSQQAMAIPALFGAVEPDSLQAAFDALYAAAATYGPDHPALFAEVRRAFPTVDSTPPQ
ncbi:hypothetical protein ACFY41_03310 [Streptomyces syringium]|uniref:hypothetical protein n=1 Tax=Streptomyces syringium TaxID=76729 RepID=UPI0036AB8175